jgi:hypothetical protein
VLDVVVGENLVLALGLHGQTLFRVEVGEPSVDLELGGIELVDLLVDGDGFEEEAILGVVVGDLTERLDRLVGVVDADPEVADAVQGVDVVRIVFEETLVLLDRRFDFALGDELLRVSDDFIALNRHLPLSSRTASSALPPLRTICDVSGWVHRPSAPLGDLRSHTPGCA